MATRVPIILLHQRPADLAVDAASDFLAYGGADGLFAEFYFNRHLFITGLERAGLSPKMAQTLARHSDVRLTLNVYTHVGLHDQSTAIASLPPPPGQACGDDNEVAALRATGTDGPAGGANGSKTSPSVVPTMVPRDAENGAGRPAPKTVQFAPICTNGCRDQSKIGDTGVAASPSRDRRFRTDREQSA
jgi:hypothetical protein